jgi:murein tripeptide amidase MpaA
VNSAYLSEDQREERLDTLARALGTTVTTIGASVEGRPISAVTIDRGHPHTVLVTANMHGVEFVGCLAALRVLQRCADKTDVDAVALLDRANVVCVPCVNPDGYARTWRQDGVGTVKELRTNARGVDLNRNFPVPHASTWHRRHLFPSQGTDDDRVATFRGVGPASEPETQALLSLIRQHSLIGAVAYHSFMGSLIPPKTTSTSDARQYRSLCRTFRQAEKRQRSFTLFFPSLDVFTGELDDWLHHEAGAWALTVEIFPIWRSVQQHLRSPSLFWRFNPRAPDRYVDDAAAGALRTLAATARLGRQQRWTAARLGYDR